MVIIVILEHTDDKMIFVVEDRSLDEGVTCLPAIKDAVSGEFFGTVFTLWSTRAAQHVKYEGLMEKRKTGCM